MMFEVDTGVLVHQAQKFVDCATSMSRLETRLRTAAGKRVCSSSGYGSALQAMYRDAGLYADSAKSLHAFADAIRKTSELYATTESEVLSNAQTSLKTSGRSTKTRKRQATITVKSDSEIGDVDAAETLLNAISKLTKRNGLKSYTDIVAGLLGYLQSLSNMFNPDGWAGDGLKQFFDLYKDSAGLWKTLYDALERHFDVAETNGLGLFNANGKIFAGWVSLFGDATGLLSTVTELTDGQYADKADFFGELISKYGSGSVDVLKGVHELQEGIEKALKLKEGADVASKTSGIYSPAALWAVFGQVVFSYIGQGVKSWNKYYADGKWDLGDTSEFLIDTSSSGLVTLFDKLLFGIPSKVFGLDADNMSTWLKKHVDNYGDKLAYAAIDGGWAWIFGG